MSIANAPFACPGCGEARLVDVEGETWACRVCGQQGARVLRLVASQPSSSASPSRAPAGQLHALLLALVQRHLTPGTWQVVAIAPLGQWPRGLQKELTQTLSASAESVVLVLERVPS
jgi:hypothetical protein